MTGKLHPSSIWQQFDSNLWVLFGGWTKSPLCEGVWKNKEGIYERDKSQPYEIVVKTRKSLNTLKEYLKRMKVLFGQYQIYFAVVGKAEFL
jgi:hypothetical protein